MHVFSFFELGKIRPIVRQQRPRLLVTLCRLSWSHLQRFKDPTISFILSKSTYTDSPESKLASRTSKPRVNMPGQSALDGPATPVGERLATEPSHGDDRPLPALPADVIINVLHHFTPTGPLTSYDSTAMRPDVSHDFLQWRVSLANFILASRLFYQVGTPFLYRMVLLSDQKEVLYFFRTIAKLSDRRLMVRSLAWVTVLSTDDVNIQSTLLRQSQVDSISAECWDSIREEWPRQSIDSHVAEISKLLPLY